MTSVVRLPVEKAAASRDSPRSATTFNGRFCGNRIGDPHCALHAHHILRLALGGPDVPENVITLCDLCLPVVNTVAEKILPVDDRKIYADQPDDARTPPKLE